MVKIFIGNFLVRYIFYFYVFDDYRISYIFPKDCRFHYVKIFSL